MKQKFDPKKHVFALDEAKYGNPILLIVKVISPQGVTKEQLERIKERRRSKGNMNDHEEDFKEFLVTTFKEVANCNIEITTGSNCL
jgi:hypothetical protein